MPRPNHGTIAIALIALAGCGRLGFEAFDGDGGVLEPDATANIDATAPDAAIDGPTPDAASSVDAAPPDAATTADASSDLVLTITDTINDGSVRDGDYFPTGDASGNLHMGRSSGANAWGYYRFQLPDGIPAGATIDAARLRVTASASQGWDPNAYGLRVFLEDDPNAAVVNSPDENPDSTVPGFQRFVLGTFADWGPGGLSWPLDQRLETPDLSAMVQALVDAHGGVDAGGHVQLWIRGEGYTVNATVAALDSGQSTADAPELVLSWTP